MKLSLKPYKTASSAEKNMKKEYEELASNFAKAIIAQDFDSAHRHFASWLQKEVSPEDLQNIFEKWLWEMNEVWEIEELIYPADFSVDGNSSSLESLKAESDWREPRKFSDELTDENFRQWMVIEFLPDETDERVELDAWVDLWMTVAEENGEPKIGYFELEDVD